MFLIFFSVYFFVFKNTSIDSYAHFSFTLKQLYNRQNIRYQSATKSKIIRDSPFNLFLCAISILTILTSSRNGFISVDKNEVGFQNREEAASWSTCFKKMNLNFVNCCCSLETARNCVWFVSCDRQSWFVSAEDGWPQTNFSLRMILVEVRSQFSQYYVYL